MISVVIPVLNEAETIKSVVQFARRDSLVSEVIVVDDGSIDGTPDLARAAGARVLTSTLLGKGASMEDGTRVACNELVLFLDGDLRQLVPDAVRRMTEPLLDDEADFVKATFSRAAGRVTTLTARPLLKTFFPELGHFEQPLAGIVAARRGLLRSLRLENDYGVDVGLLIDAALAGARLKQVSIGHVEHDSHPLETLGDMAAQVTRAVLTRAARHGRMQSNQLREVAEVERQMQAELSSVFDRVERAQRLALFDMDGVLLDGRFIVSLARRANRCHELATLLDNPQVDPDRRTRAIAALFAGTPQDAFHKTAREMPLVSGASDTIVALRKAGYRVGIVTDSYISAAEVVRRRVFADFSVAHLMQFRHGKATGEVTFAPAMVHPQGCGEHAHCKLNVLKHLTERLGIAPHDVLAVGDGENDTCMLSAAGVSVAFRPKTPLVEAAARYTCWNSLRDVLEVCAAHA